MWKAMQDVIVFGRDLRMNFVAEYFYNLGFDVYETLDACSAHACIITAPSLSYEEEQALSGIRNQDVVLYYGLLSNECLQTLKAHDIRCFCYLKQEKMVSENAILTARGIVKTAAKADAVLYESHCLVLGYGHCGCAIAKALKNSGANVDVMVRRKDLKSSIEAEGFGFLNLLQQERYCYEKYSYVFNTIPALVLTKELLARMPHSIMIFDIASKPGGTDFSYCRQHEIRADLYLGLPGKLYPREAGEIIASCVYEQLPATEPLTQE